VVVDQTFAGIEDYDFVGSQDFEGGALAAEHLVKLGHRNLANLYHLKTSTGRARLAGFRSAMQKHGLVVRDEWMREIHRYGTDEALAHAKALLTGPNRPTAVVAFNDWVAVDVLAAAHDAGLSVPADVSVVGFADLKLASVVRPRLTTIAQDPLMIGRKAAGRLLELLTTDPEATAPSPPRSDRVPVTLRQGDSTRAIPAAQT
jgi:DNA-binding LacI/PurR family transcriptional regulator